MSLNRICRASWYDFSEECKLYGGYPLKYRGHHKWFYDFDIVVQRNAVDKGGLIVCTFELASTHKISRFSSLRYPYRHAIFQRSPHYLRTAIWRKTFDSVRGYGPDEDNNPAYQRVMRRIRLGEFSK